MNRFHLRGPVYMFRFMIGAAAAALSFAIPASALTPALSSVSPSTIQAGSTVTLTLNGSNLATGEDVTFAGSDIYNFPGCTTTCAISYAGVPTQITVIVTAPTTVGMYTIQVATSNKLNVNVVAGGTNPIPSPTSLAPAAATAGGAGFLLTLTGSNFVSGSIVLWNGLNHTTNFVNGAQLTASISASDIANAGTVYVSVSNPAPGGGTSKALTFTIKPGSSANPNAPTFSLWPSSAIAGGSAFTLTVYGGGFTSGSQVYWNGSSRTTTFISTTQLQAAINAGDIANAGSARVAVFPAPSGLSSRGVVFPITSSQTGNLAPGITWVSPVTTSAGGSTTNLNVYGSNFVSGSTVLWNGGSLATTFLNSNQLMVQVPAINIASPGMASLTTFNPYPSGGITGYVGQWLYPIITPGVTTFAAGPQPTGMAPAAVAVDTVLHHIYVVHREVYRDVGADSVVPTSVLSVVDEQTRNVITTIGLGSGFNGLGQGIAVDETRHLVYVTNAADSTVTVIDGNTKTTVNTVVVDQNPQGIAVDPAGGIVYVAGNNVTLLDATQNGKLIASVSVGGAAWAVAVDRSTHLAYVLVESIPASVVAVDGASRNIKSQVSLPAPINTYTAIAVDAGFRAYAGDYNSGTITPVDIGNSSALAVLTGFNGGALPHDYIEAVAVDPNTHFVYVADSSQNSVSIFTSSGTLEQTIPVLRFPSSIAVDAISGFAYVADVESDSLSILDMADKTLSGTIPLGVLAFDIALDPTTKRLYAGNFAADAISVLDGVNHTAVGSWLSGAGVWAVAVDPGLQFVYGLNATEGTLAVLSLADGSVKARLPLGSITTGVVAVSSTTQMVYVSGGSGGVTIVNPKLNPPQIVTTVPVGGTPVGIAIDETAGWIYVAHINSNNSGAITVLDAVTNQVVHTWQTTQPVWKLAVDPALGQLYATLPTFPGGVGGSTGLLVFNSSTGAFITQVASGAPAVAPPWILSNAEDVAVNPATHHVFFTNSENGTVTVVNGPTYAVIKTFVTGTSTNGLAIDSAAGLIYVANPFDATIGVLADPPTPANPVPTLTSVNPPNVTAGGAAFTLTVNGSNFISGSTVQWNGNGRTTTFISAAQLQAAILASDVAGATSAQVTVSNPSPGGGVSNGLTFTITATGSGMMVTTIPTGLTISVDSVPYTAPHAFSWTAGSSHTIGVSSPQGSGTRDVFSAWSDFGTQTHTITTPSIATTFAATFTTQYQLTGNTTPTSDGAIYATAYPSDGYYDSGTSVQVSAVPNSGFQFVSWGGAISGATNPQNIVMTAPINLIAVFARIGANSIPGGSGTTKDFGGTGWSGALLYDILHGQSYTAVSNANGTYQYVPNLFTAGFDTLRTGDFNGDGKADLIVYNSHSALAYIGFGKGDGTFNFQSLFWSPTFDIVEIGDINGDGSSDVALYNSTTGTLYTGISNGSGTFTYQYHLVSIGFTCIRLADFTGDGLADLFLYNAATGLAFLGVGDGNGNFTFHAVFISLGYNLADVGDLNGDGKMDIILYNSVNGNAATGISNGFGGFAFTPLIFSPGFTSVRLADYTGDGKADVTVYNKNNAAAYFGTGNGAGSFLFQSLFWSPGYDFVLPEDVNGDGKADVMLYNSSTGTEYTGIGKSGGFAYTYTYWGIGRVLAK